MFGGLGGGGGVARAQAAAGAGEELSTNAVKARAGVHAVGGF